jgi:hypothetical protein
MATGYISAQQMSHFEVLDWAGDPFYRPGEYVSVGTLASPANEKRKVLLLCP